MISSALETIPEQPASIVIAHTAAMIFLMYPPQTGFPLLSALRSWNYTNRKTRRLPYRKVQQPCFYQETDEAFLASLIAEMIGIIRIPQKKLLIP